MNAISSGAAWKRGDLPQIRPRARVGRERLRARGSLANWLAVLLSFPLIAGCARRSEPTEVVASRAVSALQSAGSGKAVKVQYKVGDPGANADAHVKPHLKLVSYDTVAIPLSEIKVRYWYTIEAGSAQGFWVDYAQLGANKLAGTLVKLPAPRVGATHYLELGFVNAGSLAAGANTGEMQLRFNKTDFTPYMEADDHSFGSGQTSYADHDKITVYRNGELVWGTEPLPSPTCDTGTRLSVEYRPGDVTSPTDNHVKPHLKLVNNGTVDVPLKEVTIRYWYSREGTSAQEFFVDYAQIGASKVTGRFVPPPASATGANYYLEIGFSASAGTLLGGARTELQTRFNKVDWSTFDERDDFSYVAGRTSYAGSDRITVYRNGALLSGIEPTLGAPIPGQSVLLTATKTYSPPGSTDGIQQFPTPVPFTLPVSIPVSAGNAGNQMLTLSFATASGTVSCTYQGGAPVAHPTTPDDQARGSYYFWVSCTTCVAPGSVLFPTQVTLHINGGDSQAGPTAVTERSASPNEPPALSQPLPVDSPFCWVSGDPNPPPELRTADTPPRSGASPNYPEYNPALVISSNPMQVGNIDQPDPNDEVLQ